MDRLQIVKRVNLWQQPVYATLLKEIDPFQELSYFRSLNQAYDGSNIHWQTPSPEPLLPNEFLTTVAQFPTTRLQESIATLAATIIDWQPDATKLLLVAILRAGVPIADGLARLLPGAVAVSLSLFTGLGLDQVAWQTIQRDYPNRRWLFVDGWTGRGGVAREIAKLGIAPLAVLVDPWGWANFAGCYEDIFCPSACFTGPTTLGFSRTFYIDDQSMFAAYLFPEKYTRPDIIEQWRANYPTAPTKPLEPISRFFKQTTLRVHSNEVCRALINANPKIIYLADDQHYATEHYNLLIQLAELRHVPVQFCAKWLSDYQAKVACE